MTLGPITSYHDFVARASAERRGYDFFVSVLDHVWEAKRNVIDWLDLEQYHRDVLASTILTAEQKVRLLREAWGAYTGRGEA